MYMMYVCNALGEDCCGHLKLVSEDWCVRKALQKITLLQHACRHRLCIHLGVGDTLMLEVALTL